MLRIASAALAALGIFSWTQLPEEGKVALHNNLLSLLPSHASRHQPVSTQTIYRWKDQDGDVHYSDTPPNENQDASPRVERLEVAGARHVIPGYKALATERARPMPPFRLPDSGSSPIRDLPSLLKDAQAANEKVNARAASLQNL